MTKRPVVVLLHGMARTHRSMEGLRREIARAGYDTWAVTYPSRTLPIRDLANGLVERIQRELPGRALLAVTHSLGGILVRHMAERIEWEGAVMLAPPNRGSRFAARFQAWAPFAWIYGPAGQDVTRSETWPAPPSPFAIIAGTRAVSIGNPLSWLSHTGRLFDAGVANDGTVAVDETRLEGAVAFGTVDASHTWIMDHPQTRRWVMEFLARRTFDV